MPRHDPTSGRNPMAPDGRRAAAMARTALAWARYKRLMSWVVIAALFAVLLAIIHLRSEGRELPIHMVIATAAGVGFSMLLGTALMGLLYFSNNSGHGEGAHRNTASTGPDDQAAIHKDGSLND